MKFTTLHLKTYKEGTKNAESINAELLGRAGYIDQVAAGIYTYLPLGLRTLKKIENIIREEMDAVGGVELLMPALQPSENWKLTGRWDSLDDLFRFESYYTKTELALGPTHEEIVVPLMKKQISSYKDLPQAVYQIQDKFRDEKRAKAGLLRGREFIMKDLYSFHADEADLDDYYLKLKAAYENIFKRIGIGESTYYTFASGGSFAKYSHEFQTESKSGEDTIYLCKKCRVAINKEIIAEQKVCPECGAKDLQEKKAIEVGNIFKLKTKYSKPFGLAYTDRDNRVHDVVMGCYGIGLGRLMGSIVEVSHDSQGIIWPKSVAPFSVHLISADHETTYKTAEKIYADLSARGLEVLWDDREDTLGTKFADADLLGLPVRLLVSKKTLDNDSVELKQRGAEKSEKVKIDVLNHELDKVLNAK